MSAICQWATLVVTTMFAAAGAAAFLWLLLRGAFWMLRPLTARRIPVRRELVCGTRQLARAFALAGESKNNFPGVRERQGWEPAKTTEKNELIRRE